MGDIGDKEKRRRIELVPEPKPEEAPVKEPAAPEPVKEPVPA